MPETVSDPLTRRTPESEVFYNLKPSEYANFHVRRPVVMIRSNTGHVGVSLEYSHTGGRAWQIVSCHDTVFEALEAFANLPLGKDSDPRHYRILKES